MRADPPVALLLAASRRGRRASTTTSAPATAALWKPKLRWHQADLGVEGLEAAVGEAEADGGEDAVAVGASIALLFRVPVRVGMTLRFAYAYIDPRTLPGVQRTAQRRHLVRGCSGSNAPQFRGRAASIACTAGTGRVRAGDRLGCARPRRSRGLGRRDLARSALRDA